MKILMVGLGSIGQRHLRNIKRLFGEEAEILAYRVRRLSRTFSDDMQIRDGVDLEKEFGIKVYDDLDKALSEKPDAVFVTNITSKHTETALKAAQSGAAVFLEKPVSDCTDGLKELKRIVDEKGTVLYMGYQNRFHPCISDVRSVLGDERLGKVISVDNEFSERLTTMHRYEDYKDTYMARKDMGGGPVLNLQIHCLDYLQLLFGTPVDVYSICSTLSGLSVDVEDTAGSLYRFKENDGRMITVYSHTDFLQFPPVHRLKVVCEKGRIEADFNAAVTNVYAGDEPVQTITHEGFVRNDMFIEELREFAECIKEKKTPSSSLDAGITGLKMALAAKKSSAENRAVKIEEIELS